MNFNVHGLQTSQVDLMSLTRSLKRMLHWWEGLHGEYENNFIELHSSCLSLRKWGLVVVVSWLR